MSAEYMERLTAQQQATLRWAVAHPEAFTGYDRPCADGCTYHCHQPIKVPRSYVVPWAFQGCRHKASMSDGRCTRHTTVTVTFSDYCPACERWHQVTRNRPPTCRARWSLFHRPLPTAAQEAEGDELR